MLRFIKKMLGLSEPVEIIAPEINIKIDNIEDYGLMASKTCADLGLLSKNNMHMVMGVTTEIGEMIDAYKKHLVYKKTFDIVNVMEELADAMWYLVNYTRINNLNLPDLTNIRRYKLLSKETFVDKWEIVDELLLTLEYFLKNPKTNYFKTIIKLYVLTEIINRMDNSSITFFSALEKNIRKLMVRYPNKFSEFHAENRNLIEERNQLEN
jgi:NTP pyrophosphatase (non-canonical NTP hydrolase)